MIDEKFDERTSDYLPYTSLIRGPDYQKLFNIEKGAALYNLLKMKFGRHQHNPYRTPREEDKEKYHKHLIDDNEYKKRCNQENLSIFLGQIRLKRFGEKKKTND